MNTYVASWRPIARGVWRNALRSPHASNDLCAVPASRVEWMANRNVQGRSPTGSCCWHHTCSNLATTMLAHPIVRRTRTERSWHPKQLKSFSFLKTFESLLNRRKSGQDAPFSFIRACRGYTLRWRGFCCCNQVCEPHSLAWQVSCSQLQRTQAVSFAIIAARPAHRR